MNEAMPHWRTFSSNAPTELAEGEGTLGAVNDRGGPSAPRLVVVLAAALGGAAAGAALVVMVAAAMASAPRTGLTGGIDQAPAGAAAGLNDYATVAGTDLTGATSLANGDDEIVVDVAGAVVQPGLHRLAAGGRVGDAIAAAGGFAPRANLAEAGRSLNLAQPLSDGAKVLVPELGVEGPGRAAADDDRIDLNTADQAELESLPGIGPVTAAQIIEARSQQRFSDVGDLLDRDVVGQAVFEDIEDLVRASG